MAFHDPGKLVWVGQEQKLKDYTGISIRDHFGPGKLDYHNACLTYLIWTDNGLQILLGKLIKNGKWTIMGGMKESYDKDPFATGARELSEESGIKISDIYNGLHNLEQQERCFKFLWQGKGNRRTIIYVMFINGNPNKMIQTGSVQNTEVSEIRWVSIGEFNKLCNIKINSPINTPCLLAAKHWLSIVFKNFGFQY